MPLIIGYFFGKIIGSLLVSIVRLAIIILTLVFRLLTGPVFKLVKWGLVALWDLYKQFCVILDKHFEYRNAAPDRLSFNI